MITPDNHAGFLQQLLLSQESLVLRSFQPVRMITMIPKQRFMRDDQIGSAGVSLADHINRSITSRHNPRAFLIRISIQNLIPSCRFVDRFPSDRSAMVLLHFLNNFTYFHNEPPACIVIPFPVIFYA